MFYSEMYYYIDSHFKFHGGVLILLEKVVLVGNMVHLATPKTS